MTHDQQLLPALYQGWHAYQQTLIKAIAPLDSDQLDFRTAPDLLSIGEIAAHIVINRAVWFFFIMHEGGDEFETIGRRKARGDLSRSADEIVKGLAVTWTKMHDIITGWTDEDWGRSWPDAEDDSTPDVLTPEWIVWHMIEHDIHHGGEISIMLGSHGLQGLKLSG